MTEARLGNWGRWGENDEIGSANMLTPDHVLRSMRTAATRGRVYPLAQPIRATGTPRSDSGLALHFMSQDGGDYATGSLRPVGSGQSVAMDYLMLRLHGSATHVDALGHVWSGDRLYNGHPSATASSGGLAKCGADKIPGIVTRGVLLDLPAAAGTDRLDPNHEIDVAEMETCLEREGVGIQTGDAVLIRTGWPSTYASDPAEYVWNFPGLGRRSAEWLAAKDIVLVGADTLGVEARTRAEPWDLPVHLCLLYEHGIYMVEMLDLDALARDAVHQFLFVMAPLPIDGGSGSPVNPLAIA